MKIKYFKDKQDKNIPARVMACLNRGIDPKEIPTYLRGGTNSINAPEELGAELLKAGARILISCISENKKAFIIVDSDCDGLTSSAHLINYLYTLAPSWTSENLSWGLHEGKQHGLNDFIDKLEISDNSLVICPDSATNDVDAIERLHNKNIDVLILDHHLSDVPMSPYAVTINSQYNYPNPELSGVGVVHKFCQYIDKALGKDYSDKFKDLTAIGLMGDMMNMTSFETKEMIFDGLKEENIVNPLIAGLAKKNEFALSKSDYKPSQFNGLSITPIGAAFFIIPLLNALCRSGNMEEKELVFNSMLTMKAFEMIPSNKRGHKLGEEERVLDQALRCCTNVKNRQTRAEETGMEWLESKVAEIADDKVYVFINEDNNIDRNIAGLCANKMMARYQRPVCVISPLEDGTYAGSMRGYTATGIKSFKEVAETSDACNWTRGHDNAAGICINDISKFVSDMNTTLKDISTEVVYYVDYIFKPDTIDDQVILDLASMNDYIGTGFERPQVYIEDIDISALQVMKSNTVKINTPSATSIIMFGVEDDEIEKMQSGDYTMNAVCKCAINEWCGNISPQLMVIDYELVKIQKSNIELWGF